MMRRFVMFLLMLTLVGCAQETNNQKKEIVVENETIEVPNVIIEKNEKPNVYELGKSTVLYPSADGLDITADLYLIDETSPMFVLFHQAGWSRGEYMDTALKFNKKGYNVMAVDQRSGMTVNGVLNETAKRASENGFPRNHVDAAMDVKASIQYAIDNFDTDLYLLGSSYSASLILVTSQAYSEHVDALFAFSPGEYFPYGGQSISNQVEELTIPTFVTSASYEIDEWENIFEHVGSEDKFAFYPEGFGKHGSQSLWSSTKEHTEFWIAMNFFLESLEKDAE